MARWSSLFRTGWTSPHKGGTSVSDGNKIQIDSSLIYRPNQPVAGKKELDRDAFLKILMTQLQNQDPSQPMQDKEFIAQMAQFSSLEQMNKVSQMNSLMLGTQLLGNIVTYKANDGTVLTGEVSGVHKAEGTVKVKIGDSLIDISNIESVTQKQQ
jgi:flagellar basal-body rod modification protein FlgD